MKKSTRHKRAPRALSRPRPLPAATPAADTVVLLPVAPTSVHVYWQLPSTEQEGDAGERQLRLRFYDRSEAVASGKAAPADWAAAGVSGKCYVTLEPDRVYEAEAGWVDGDGNFQSIAQSNRVTTLRLPANEQGDAQEVGAALHSPAALRSDPTPDRGLSKMPAGGAPPEQAVMTIPTPGRENPLSFGSESPPAEAGWEEELVWSAMVAELQLHIAASSRPAAGKPLPSPADPEWSGLAARFSFPGQGGGWPRVREQILHRLRGQGVVLAGLDDWTTICERKFKGGISSGH